MAKQQKIHFIINPISGIKKKGRLIDLLKKELDPAFSYGVDFTEYAQHATELAREAVKRGAKAVIAVGGDGTINEVAKALIGTECSLGVIPMGSGNGFARHLKIPLQSRAAILRINRMRSKLIDTGLANGELFLCTVGLGFDALVGSKFATFGKRGLLSYMQISAEEFFNFRAKEFVLKLDGKEMKTEAFLINFANIGQYGNNAWIAPAASVEDGLLNVSLLEPFPQVMTGDIVLKLFNKQLAKSKYYHSYTAKEIEVLTPSIYHIDGEAREESTLQVKVNAGNLKVIY